MDARTAVLARARDAISRSQRGRPVREIPRDYIRVGAHPPGSEPVVADMVEKLEDYSADVVLAPDDEQILDAVDELLGGARIVVVPSGLPGACKRAAARRGRVVREDSREAPIPILELDEVDAVVTCARVAVSLSGTIILDGEPDQGRRAITLVPDTRCQPGIWPPPLPNCRRR